MESYARIGYGLAAVCALLGLAVLAGFNAQNAGGPHGPPGKGDTTMAIATFGAGCFWGVEATFEQVDGVEDAVSGYAGGHTEEPTYEEVCAGDTGHAEVVQVHYDPEKVSYEDLLDVFWECHDPTQVNRQGPDVGYQYRSVIFYHDKAQKAAAEKSKARLAESSDQPAATSIEPAGPFWRAEEYHQDYLKKRGRGPAGH